MKLRFFFTIFFVLLVAVSCACYTCFYFFHTERFRLIDRQIEENASLLYSSDLSRAQLEDIDEAEEIISDALGGEESDLLIRIQNGKNKILFKNRNAYLLNDLDEVEKGWRTVSIDGHTIRLLTLPLPDKRRFLEVGLLLDRQFIHWKQLSYKVIAYVALLVFFLLGISIFLSHLLLRPLRVLAAYLKYLSTKVDEGVSGDPPLPKTLRVRPGLLPDEFVNVTTAVQALTRKIVESLSSMQTWTAQMVHEIRTPLTIAANSLETARAKANEPAQPPIEDALEEIRRVGLIVGDFLEFAKIENSTKENAEIHALRLGSLCASLVQRLNGLYSDRIEFKEENNPTVFARPELVEQLLSNLIENALKYSVEKVSVKIGPRSVVIEDRGPGLPESVRKRLGQPFNSAQVKSTSATHGTGLGLARVVSICRKYGWKLEFENLDKGCKASVGVL